MQKTVEAGNVPTIKLTNQIDNDNTYTSESNLPGAGAVSRFTALAGRFMELLGASPSNSFGFFADEEAFPFSEAFPFAVALPFALVDGFPFAEALHFAFGSSFFSFPQTRKQTIFNTVK